MQAYFSNLFEGVRHERWLIPILRILYLWKNMRFDHGFAKKIPSGAVVFDFSENCQIDSLR